MTRQIKKQHEIRNSVPAADGKTDYQVQAPECLDLVEIAHVGVNAQDFEVKYPVCGCFDLISIAHVGKSTRFIHFPRRDRSHRTWKYHPCAIKTRTP